VTQATKADNLCDIKNKIAIRLRPVLRRICDASRSLGVKTAGLAIFPIPATLYSRGAFYFQLLFAIGALYWSVWLHYSLPSAPPGLAIGILAVAAVIITVRVEYNWTKVEQVIWILLAFSYLGIESNNLFQTQAELEFQQQETSDMQQRQFSAVLRQNQKEFNETMKRSKEILDQTQLAVDKATEAVQQTAPVAGIEFTNYNWIPGPPGSFEVNYANNGNDSASDIWWYQSFYLESSDDAGSLRAFANFQRDWEAGKHHVPYLARHEMGHAPQNYSPIAAMTRAPVGEGKAVYYFFRAEYKDTQGLWGSLSCRKIFGPSAAVTHCSDVGKIKLNV
jgi:hypothetical protein